MQYAHFRENPFKTEVRAIIVANRVLLHDKLDNDNV